MVEITSDACVQGGVGQGINDELTFSPASSDTMKDDIQSSEPNIHTPKNLDEHTTMEESQEVRVAIFFFYIVDEQCQSYLGVLCRSRSCERGKSLLYRIILHSSKESMCQRRFQLSTPRQHFSSRKIRWKRLLLYIC